MFSQFIQSIQYMNHQNLTLKKQRLDTVSPNCVPVKFVKCHNTSHPYPGSVTI